MVYLEIENLEGLVAFIREAQGIGLLKGISLEGVISQFRGKKFPIRVPIDLNAVLGLCQKKSVRLAYGKTIEETTKKYILKAIEAGC